MYDIYIESLLLVLYGKQLTLLNLLLWNVEFSISVDKENLLESSGTLIDVAEVVE